MNFDLETILTVLPYIAGVLAWFFKERILNALNVQLKRNEVDSSITENLTGNLNLYQRLLDDYEARSQKVVEQLESRIKDLEVEIVVIMEERDIKIKENRTLLEKVEKIQSMLERSLNQLDYYKKNTTIQLPESLR